MADLPELSPLKITRTRHVLDQAAANRLNALIVIAPDGTAPANGLNFRTAPRLPGCASNRPTNA